ncbi:primase C-terminal domain-containing protein, partial [Staphylococcus warneri]|uniref:primase C-terminal domain-containing protein n=1 Tax=Staphylococcus warneri TaxID=1292 RepID=UPI0034CF36BB
SLPVKKLKDSIYIFKYNDAPAITIEELNKMVVKNEPITVNYSNQFKKRDSAYWREIAFGVGKGERNQTLASLTGYLLRRYVDANLVYGLVSAWAMTCR